MTHHYIVDHCGSRGMSSIERRRSSELAELGWAEAAYNDSDDEPIA